MIALLLDRTAAPDCARCAPVRPQSALHFVFMSFYSQWLLLPAAVGLGVGFYSLAW